MARQASPIARGSGAYAGSVSEGVLVVGHRVRVVTGFVGVGSRQPMGRQSGGPASAEATADRRVVPGAEVAEDFLELLIGICFCAPHVLDAARVSGAPYQRGRGYRNGSRGLVGGAGWKEE